MTSPVAHALLVWHPFRSCLVWHPFRSCLVWHPPFAHALFGIHLLLKPCLAVPFCSRLASVASPFTHVLLVWHPLLLSPCWCGIPVHALFGIPFCSCLAVVASPLAHALRLWHPPWLMPCWCGISFHSCLAGMAPPFPHALLLLSLMPCCLLRQLALMLAPHTGLNIREDQGHRGSMRASPHCSVLLKASTCCSSDLQLSREPSAQPTLSRNQGISLGSRKA